MSQIFLSPTGFVNAVNAFAFYSSITISNGLQNVLNKAARGCALEQTTLAAGLPPGSAPALARRPPPVAGRSSERSACARSQRGNQESVTDNDVRTVPVVGATVHACSRICRASLLAVQPDQSVDHIQFNSKQSPRTLCPRSFAACRCIGTL